MKKIVAFLLYLVCSTNYILADTFNNLINEQSPYLKKHSTNPVNWYAWSEETLKEAQKQNKLIYLSIGYSTCHWCDVMEEESFKNKEIAELLNKYFISIKIDKEQMPHIDKYYQDIHEKLNNSRAGWPFNVFLNSQMELFYTAGYIPIDDRFGQKNIKEQLTWMIDSFKNNSQEINKKIDEIKDFLLDFKNVVKVDLNSKLKDEFLKSINNSFDYENFGINLQPKFPNASMIKSLLDIYVLYKDEKALFFASSILKSMAKGGIYDQIEGGFFRYSVDAKYQIPHFEKMLYTNAELIQAYSKAYLITKDDFYKQIAQETISFIEKRFKNDNLFFSASDAVSLRNNEKFEGAYYLFNYDEVEEFLENKTYTSEEIEKILDYFNITFEGNFENGLSNAYLKNATKPNNLEKIKEDLRELRALNPFVFVDYKILTSWNAMYISSLFEAGKFDEIHSKNALIYLETLLENLYVNEKLYHQKINNYTLEVEGLLEDYAFLIEALLNAYNFSLNEKYLNIATKLTKKTIKKFYINNHWLLSNDYLKVKGDFVDSAYKSALVVMIDNILKVSALTDDLNLFDIAQNSIKSSSYLNENLINNSWFLRTLIFYQKAYTILKAPKERLNFNSLDKYPLVLKKSNSDKKYLACKIGLCYAFSNDKEEIINKILKELEVLE